MKLQAYLKQFRKQPWMVYCTKYTYTLVYVHIDQAIKLVRDQQNPDYVSYHYREIGSEKLTTPDVVWNIHPTRNVVICLTFSIRTVLEQGQNLNQTQKARIEQVSANLPDHDPNDNPIPTSIPTRLFGIRCTSAGKLVCVIHCVGWIARDSGGTLLTCAEGGGGFARMFLRNFPNIRIVYNSLPEPTIADAQSLPVDCQQLLPLELIRRLSFLSFRNKVGDLTDLTTVSNLIYDIGDDNLIMITVDSQTHWDHL